MKPEFNFENSKAEFFVDEQGHKVRIYSRDCGKSPLVHGAYLMDGYWSIRNYTVDGEPVYAPLGYPIVGEWKEPHPAESWPQGKIVEVSDVLGGPKFLRRFYEYDPEDQVFKCFEDGENWKGDGGFYEWGFAREPK